MKEYENDFSTMPTRELADESIARAQDLDSYTGPMWDALGPLLFANFALVGGFVFTLMEGLASPRFQIFPKELAAIYVVIGFAIWWPFFRKWNDARRACRAYTNEMDARTKELKLRNEMFAEQRRLQHGRSRDDH